MRSEFLVCYDITDARRLRRVLRIMRDFGDWVQYSVFWCRLSSTEQAALEARLLDTIHHVTDQVLFIRLGAEQRESVVPQGSRVLGKPFAPSQPRRAVL